MNGFNTFFYTYLPVLLLTVPVVLLSLTLHEYAHARVAYRLGDPTAKRCGRLTLNPIRHLDPLGSLCMLFFGVGWARPVPINPLYFKDTKKGTALVAAAGPITNLLISFFAAFFYRLFLFFVSIAPNAALFYISYFAAFFFFQLHFLNLYLAIFNLIPLPPFDGSRILFVFLNNRQYFAIMKYERLIQFGFLILIYFGFANGFLSFVAEPISDLFMRLFSLIIPIK